MNSMIIIKLKLKIIFFSDSSILRTYASRLIISFFDAVS